MFAFDEIVTLGCQENANPAQKGTFTEIGSHEEKLFRAVRETQEREAKAEMQGKAKELQQPRKDAGDRATQQRVLEGLEALLYLEAAQPP